MALQYAAQDLMDRELVLEVDPEMSLLEVWYNGDNTTGL